MSEDMDKQWSNRLTPATNNRNLIQERRDCRSSRSSKDANLPRNDSFTSRVQNPYNSLNNGRNQRGYNFSAKNLSKEINHDTSISNRNELLGFYYDDDYSINYKRKGGAYKPNFKLWQHFNTRKSDEVSFYNKEQFIQANCQFVVYPTMDHSVHLIDPDVIVDWSEVFQVRIMSHEVPQCPICLYPPTAARMTKCGHIYCWPCALQYISYENDMKSKKCAICCEHVYPEDLKSVIAKSRRVFTEGDSITMVLMQRDKGFTQALPISSDMTNVPLKAGSEDEKSAGFAKLLTSNISYQTTMLEQDLNELVGASLDGDNESIQPYIESLIEKLKYQLNELNISFNELSPINILSKAKRPNRLTRQDSSSESHSSQHTVGVLEPPSPILKSGDMDGATADPVRRAKRTSACEDNSFYFYQAIDGQHIYLHSLNWKCLAQEYGSIDNWPREISGKVLQIEHISMSSAIRKRYRYLSHLPLTCAVSVVELELCPHVISRETISQFDSVFRKRRRERKEKEKYDRWLTKQKEKEENKFSELKPDFTRASSTSNNSRNQEKIVPEFDENDFMPLTRDSSTNAFPVNNDPPACKKVSFASMLKSPGNQGLRTSSSWSTPQVGYRHDPSRNEYDSETEELDVRFAPPVATTFGEMLSSALDAQISLTPTTTNTPAANQSGSKKKGKKSKGIVLFSI